MKHWAIFGGLFLVWLAFLYEPAAALPVGYAVYLAMALSIAWSALRHRSAGWLWGLGLAVLLATFPLWVWAAFLLFERCRP